MAALRRAFLTELDHGAATLGINPGMAAFWRVVEESAALRARVRQMRDRAEELLAETLRSETGATGDDPMPRIAAALLVAADAALHAEIRRRVQAEQDPDVVRAEARRMAGAAFDVLEKGLPAYAVRRTAKAP
ncbi:hypothetical protein [Actinoplanes palleronii]|uniref:hypothetical protein n=1 Tax=Actinoplanes palleronii TaxID=113570 RepID=UPI0019409343|nr:hypothetical protein [Actinoplanes palleronii]